MFLFKDSLVRRLATAILLVLVGISGGSYAQNTNAGPASQSLTLRQCIDYAMKHQPALNQSLINEAITRANNAVNLSGWYPQVNLSGTLTHYDVLPSAFETNPNNPAGPPLVVKTGIPNSVTPQLSATEAFISPSLIYAAKTAPLFNEQARQVTDSNKISLVASVSKAFYGVLLTLEQINVLKADTAELSRSVTDAYHQYIGGIVDETDYEEATITYNNSLVQLRQAVENVVPQYATLKQLIGFPPQQQFDISFDTSEMIRNIGIDSAEQLQYEKRIEFRLLQTAKELQQHLINYYHLAYLPTLSGFFNYDYEFGSNDFSTLFNSSYPYSSIGLSLNFPIFTGFSRVYNLRKARLQQDLLNWNEVNLKSQIYSEYTTALASYKSNLFSFHMLQKNVALAGRVYNVVELQYRQGIVPYLNVITAQSNLITSQTGYINALFQALSSKIDLQKAMGEISY